MIIFVAFQVLLDLPVSLDVCLHHKLAVENLVANFALKHLFGKFIVFKLFLLSFLLFLVRGHRFGARFARFAGFFLFFKVDDTLPLGSPGLAD